MSWYTMGEIVVWLLIAATLGGVLGWLIRGVWRPPVGRALPTPVTFDDEKEHAGTRVTEVDTGGTDSFAPVEPPGEHSDSAIARDRVAEIAARTAGGATEHHDDLARIHGVGPTIAELLVSLGITSFRQVARLTSAEVAVVNDALKVFPGRIERDDWISSARELHREVYGTEP